jgi:hypothetical protein
LEEGVPKGEVNSLDQVGVNERLIVVVKGNAFHFPAETYEFIHDMPEELNVHDLLGYWELGDRTVYAGVITRGTRFDGGFLRENGGDHKTPEGKSH